MPATPRSDGARPPLHGSILGGTIRAAGSGRRAWGWIRGAFTLVELLVVMGVIVALISLIGPVVTSLQGAGNINRAVYDIAGLLEQARTYAMSNRTYVYVGIEEIASGQASSVKPRQTGVGQVVIAVIASKDGTSGYPSTNLTKNLSTDSPGNFLVIGKVQTYDNLHLVNLGTRPDTGGMARPPYGNNDAVDPLYNLGDDKCSSSITFDYPVGSNAADYNFKKVIQFSPQGVARIQTTGNSDIVSAWLEIGLAQTHGSAAPTLPSTVTSGAVAAIQVNGVTGVVRIYRP